MKDRDRGKGSMKGDPTRIFLDTNIIVAFGGSPNKGVISWLTPLVTHGLITILTTDVTCREIAKKHAENKFKLLKPITNPRFRESVKRIFDSELPEAEGEELWRRLLVSYEEDVTSMFKKLKTKVLTVDEVKPSAVFIDYAMRRGFFEDDVKKSQFPDAFVFECLKQEAKNHGQVMIVSNDGDFEKPVSKEANLSLVKSLGAMFEEIGVKTDPPAEKNTLKFYEKQLIDIVINYLRECEMERAEEEEEGVEVGNVQVSKVEAQQTHCFRLRDDWDLVLVRGVLKMHTNVSYAYPVGRPSVSDALEVEVLLSLGRDDDHDMGGIAELSFPNGRTRFVILNATPDSGTQG